MKVKAFTAAVVLLFLAACSDVEPPVEKPPSISAAQLAQQAGWQFQGEAGPPQAVTEAVRCDGLKPWVAEQDFQGTPGGWIPFTDNGQVGSDLFEHGSAGTARLPG